MNKSCSDSHRCQFALMLITSVLLLPNCAFGSDAVVPVQVLKNESVGDQDDLCFWQHPSEPSQSVVIASDKKANRVFTYDLSGNLKQTVELDKPGNIDIRQNIRLGGKEIDLVVVNIRAGQPALRVFSVDRTSGVLKAIDGNGIPTQPNYGGCLGYDKKQERLWFFCTSEEFGVTQYELSLSDSHLVQGHEVRRWDLGKCEGAVADDDAMTLFVAVENECVWRVGMLPEDSTPGERIVSVGENGVKADLEGMCLVKLPDSTPALIVSSQGADQFFVFERNAPYTFYGAFCVKGASGTDGIELLQTDAFKRFEGGIFGCHTDEKSHPILLSSWNAILKILPERPAN